MSTLNIQLLCRKSRKKIPKLSLFASWPGTMINPQWLELPMSRTIFLWSQRCSSHWSWTILGVEGFNQFYSRKTSPLFLMQLQNTSISSVQIGFVLIREPSQWDIHNCKHYDKTKRRTRWRSEVRTPENSKLGHDAPDHMNDQAQPSRYTTLKHRRFNVKTLNRRCFNVVCPLGTLWSRIWREPSFSLRTDSSCENQRRMFGASEMDLSHQNVFFFFFLSFFLVVLRLRFWYYSVIVGPCDWSLWFIFHGLSYLSSYYEGVKGWGYQKPLKY